MRLILILLAFVVLVPSASGQRRGSISSSPGYLLICSENPLPDGYRIVRETFTEGCQPLQMRNTYVIARNDMTVLPGTDFSALQATTASAVSEIASSGGDARDRLRSMEAILNQSLNARFQLVGRAIEQGKVQLGMTTDEVLGVLGGSKPNDVNSTINESGKSLLWKYSFGAETIYLRFGVDGRLSSISNN